MTFPLTFKYAFRSLWRHVRRTILSVLGIGLGCGVCLFMVSFVRGEGEMMMRAASDSGVGHLRIVPQKWLKARDKNLRIDDWNQILAEVGEIEEVKVATARSRIDALLGFGTRTVAAEMVGVIADREQSTNRLVRNVEQGRYLLDGQAGEVVVGKAVARRLRARLGDQLMVTVSGKDGELRSAMLTIVGIVSTGSNELDASVCQVNLTDIRRIAGFEGAGEITILLKDSDLLEETFEKLKAKVSNDLAVVTWDQLVPELASGVEVDKTWTRLMVGLVIIVVFLGIASAQLTAVLERRREFAVLAAVGMKAGQLIRIMLLEGLILGLLGTVLAVVLGVPAAWWLSEKGLDFTKIYGDMDMSISNILMDPIIYGDFGWWLIPLALTLAVTATVLSSLYPAWFASRTDPATALRVEQ